MGHFGQQGRTVVTTVKGGETVPGKEGKNRGRAERDIYTRKGGSLTVIMCQTDHGESRKEKCGSVDEGGRH